MLLISVGTQIMLILKKFHQYVWMFYADFICFEVLLKSLREKMFTQIQQEISLTKNIAHGHRNLYLEKICCFSVHHQATGGTVFLPFLKIRFI